MEIGDKRAGDGANPGAKSSPLSMSNQISLPVTTASYRPAAGVDLGAEMQMTEVTCRRRGAPRQ